MRVAISTRTSDVVVRRCWKQTVAHIRIHTSAVAVVIVFAVYVLRHKAVIVTIVSPRVLCVISRVVLILRKNVYCV